LLLFLALLPSSLPPLFCSPGSRATGLFCLSLHDALPIWACLEILGLAGAGKARALAEVCAGLALAGELSIIAALSAGQFAGAHERLARGRKPAVDEAGGGA